MKNIDIRNDAKNSGVKLWKIAEKLGVSDVTFSKRLRKELSVEQKQEIKAIIKDLRKEK